MSLQTLKLQYKSDDYGNPITAKVHWIDNTSSQHSQSQSTNKGRPIILVLHAGGFIVGSADMIPPAQIQHLANSNAIVVVPNYRLAPQVTASRGAFPDVEEALAWSTTLLPKVLAENTESNPGPIDTSRVAVVGHSCGGTLALHLAATFPTQILAATAFYPSLYTFEHETSTIHQPFSLPPFGTMPPYTPTAEDWKLISPDGIQLSEAALARPGSGVPPPPRNKLQLDLLRRGKLYDEAVCPNVDDLGAIDPCTRFSEVARTGRWPPTMFVSPSLDNVPGSGPHLIERAVNELKSSGAKEVRVTSVEGQSHMFDLPPTVGTSDLDSKWEGVKKGLDFLVERL